MISEKGHDFMGQNYGKKARCNSEIQSRVVDLNGKNRINNRNDWNAADSLICDDGYFSLANIGGKNNKNLLLPPTNSWPLRRKIGAKEFKEYGDRLDSGSDSYIETKGDEKQGSSGKCEHSNAASATLIDLETMPAGSSACTASTIRNCIDYCTCMLCVKSAHYICYDGDDTGAESDDPCICSAPSRGCIKRWSCLGVLAFFFPCLLCYPVATGCVTRYERCKRTKDKAGRKRFKIRFTKNRDPTQR